MASVNEVHLKIKIFCDGADRSSLLKMNEDPRISGMTTNPTLMKKAGVTDYRSFCKEILNQIREKPISFEVFADDITEMTRQANEIAKWGTNVYVKIPVQNTLGNSTHSLVRDLCLSGIKVNVTAITTLKQVNETCRALQGGAPSIISVFSGRIADTGRDPVPILRAALELCRSFDRRIELLWASTREAYNIIQAEEMGCDIITVPHDIISKMPLFGKSLEDMSQDTVKMFKKDAETAGFSL